jgi:hypothetical protein
MIQFRRHTEIENYLHEVRSISGPNWATIADGLKNPRFRLRDQDINDLPRSTRGRIDDILKLPPIESGPKKQGGLVVSHNLAEKHLDALRKAMGQARVGPSLTQQASLSANTWELHNEGAIVDSGTIKPIEDDADSSPEIAMLVELMLKEEYKNLRTLEFFISRNPDCHEAMDMYCAEAAKHLPDEELESKIYKYTAITHTPPPLWAYSKMGNKENWSALASRVIGEGLLRLNDAPFGLMGERSPWLNLSNWEDLDLEKNAIDWHGILKSAEFWYDPMYYVQRNPMPDAVFAKYLNQATMAGDWNSVFSACGARFQWDEKKCQYEKFLAAWKQAAEKLGKSL